MSLPDNQLDPPDDSLMFCTYHRLEYVGKHCPSCEDDYVERESEQEWEEMRRGALDAGIPLDVIEGRRKLTDIFSQDYIDYKCNRPSKGEIE